jgi:hypothetical protein
MNEKVIKRYVVIKHIDKYGESQKIIVKREDK